MEVTDSPRAAKRADTPAHARKPGPQGRGRSAYKNLLGSDLFGFYRLGPVICLLSDAWVRRRPLQARDHMAGKTRLDRAVSEYNRTIGINPRMAMA